MEYAQSPTDTNKRELKYFLKHRAFLTLLFFFIGLLFFTFYQISLVEIQKDLLSKKDIELEKLRNINALANKTETISDTKKEFTSPYKCHKPDPGMIYTEDKLYYVATRYVGDALSICNTKSQQGPGEQTGKSQNGENILFSYSSNDGTENVLFLLNTKLKNLKYYTKDELKDQNNSFVFIAPDEMTFDAWSPDGTKVIIRASSCWSCDPGDGVYTYVFNVAKEEFTPLGNETSEITWIDSNTISWTTLIRRERTEADGGDGFSYPYIWEKGDSHKLIVE